MRTLSQEIAVSKSSNTPIVPGNVVIGKVSKIIINKHALQFCRKSELLLNKDTYDLTEFP